MYNTKYKVDQVTVGKVPCVPIQRWRVRFMMKGRSAVRVNRSKELSGAIS